MDLLEILSKWIDDIPPIQQPQRFGNQAFRTWYDTLKVVCSYFQCTFLFYCIEYIVGVNNSYSISPT